MGVPAARIGLEGNQPGTPFFAEVFEEVIAHFLTGITGKEPLFAFQNVGCTAKAVFGKHGNQDAVAGSRSCMQEFAHAAVGQELPQAR